VLAAISVFIEFANLSAVTASSAILAVVTASFAMVKDVDPVTSPVCVALEVLAVFAAISVFIELANLSAVTASSTILAVLTVLSPGVEILRADPN